MSHFDYHASDLTNPFTGQHVSLQEYYVVQMPKGPSMMEEKLACPMEDAAHERRFMKSQQGSSASGFIDEHVSIVARTLDVIEKMFVNSGTIVPESIYPRPTTPTDTTGCVHISDLIQRADDWTACVGAWDLDSNLALDLEDSVLEDVNYDFTPAEYQLLMGRFRKGRNFGYQRQSGGLRIHKNVSGRKKSAGNRRFKSSDSIRNLPMPSSGP